MHRFLEADSVWLDVNLTTLDPHGNYAVQRDMALAVKDGVISAIEPMKELGIYDLSQINVAGRGGWLTPGFIDCHTHLVFAGNRAREFEQRLQGIPYETIAKQGGGILSTVMATRRASEQALFDLAVPRLLALMADGATTVEIKSGYGLSLDDELKLLRVAKQLEQAFPVRIITTLLGAHALPPEYQGRSDDYIDLVCQQMIPKATEEGLVDAVDMFCEGIGFSVAQCEKVIQTARRYQLPVKGHTEQLSDLKGSQLVASYGGLSVDHLEYLDPEDLQPLIDNQTVAVLLPGAFYFLRETQRPPVQALRDAGIPMAIATDFNPGTSPFASLRWMMNMACTLFQLTPEEALAGVTCHAARALNLHKTVGMLSVGMHADMLLWNIEHPAELAYQQGIQQLDQRIYAGEVSYV